MAKTTILEIDGEMAFWMRWGMDHIGDTDLSQNSVLFSWDKGGVTDENRESKNIENVEKEQFEGGTADNQIIDLGNNSYLPEFEKNLLGKKIKDEFELEIVFPKNYHTESLREKKAVFSIVVNEISIPKLLKDNNELAKKETSRNSKELLRRLHIKENEKVIEGAEAFLALWKKMPKYKFLYNFFKLPIIFNLFSFGYEVVAFFLYLKNKKQLKN